MKWITLSQVVNLHNKMIESTGGSDGIRDKNLLESSINNALATFSNQELYPGIEEKCANICFSIIKNHPFIDGNKRMGIFIMLILLEYNNVLIDYTQEELVELGLGIADGSIAQEQAIKWIKDRKGDV